MSAFTDVTDALGALVEEKNVAYGDATRTGAEAMKALYPNGVKPEQYERFGYCLLVWHKLSRLATKPDAFGENPIHDIAGYSVLALAREKERAARVAEAKTKDAPRDPDYTLIEARALAYAAQKAKESVDGSVFGVTVASYEKFKDGKVLEPELICPDCTRTMGGPGESKRLCWTCFFIKYPTTSKRGDWYESANARELEEVQRLFVLGKADAGQPVVGEIQRPPLGQAPFEDLSKRWDAGVFEGTGKGYVPSQLYGPGRLGTPRGPLWAGKEEAKEIAAKFAELFRAMAPSGRVYKVGDVVSESVVTDSFRTKYSGYWYTEKRLSGRLWVITGVL